jgi:hypothetical protein
MRLSVGSPMTQGRWPDERVGWDMLIDAEGPVEETLELLADIMDNQDSVHVVVLPTLLREAAETIKELREDVITITSLDGEHIATIDGPLASEIYVVAVKEFIEKAIKNAMRDDAERVGDA